MGKYDDIQRCLVTHIDERFPMRLDGRIDRDYEGINRWMETHEKD